MRSLPGQLEDLNERSILHLLMRGFGVKTTIAMRIFELGNWHSPAAYIDSWTIVLYYAQTSRTTVLIEFHQLETRNSKVIDFGWSS
jgi:hypothetical protein